MKVAQLVLSAGQVCTAEAMAPLRDLEPHLVLVFATPTAFRTGLLAGLSQADWRIGTSIVGCSTAGEISAAGIEEESIVVTAICFTSTALRVVSVPLDSMQGTNSAGRELGRLLENFEPDAVLLITPGLNINGSALIRGLSESLPLPAKIFGGLAADAADFRETLQWIDGIVTQNRVIAVGLRGKHLKVDSACEGGWTPFGPVRRVTAAQENILRALDGKPALSIYRHYLGSYAQDLPASALLFPLAVLDQTGQPTLVRTILGIQDSDESLILAGDIKEGDLLQMMHATTDALVDGAQIAARKVKGMRSEARGDTLALLVSCVGRKLVMGHRTEEEWEAVQNELGSNTLLAGFYSYGEIGPKASGDDLTVLHNQTMSITHIYEKPVGES